MVEDEAFLLKAGERMSNEVIIQYKMREKRFAVRENKIVTKINTQQMDDETKVGNIYLGTVSTVKAGMNAAFINIGEDKHGYLPKEQIPAYIHSTEKNKELFPLSKFIHEGEKILVQVKKDETATKGPLLTAIIELTSEKVVYMPEGKYIAVTKKATTDAREKWRKYAQKIKKCQEGMIIRTEALSSTKEAFLEEVNMLRKQYKQLVAQIPHLHAPTLIFKRSVLEESIFLELKRLQKGRMIVDDLSFAKRLKEWLAIHPSLDWEMDYHSAVTNIFSVYGIEEELTTSLKKIVWLSNGAYITMEQTEAFVVVDVNTGKFTGKQSLEQTVLQTNIAAAKEIGRQMMIRDYSGIILIDFINMRHEKDRQMVQAALATQLQKDTKRISFSGFTSLGIFQLTRKKTENSLPDKLLQRCTVCNGTGKIKSPETIAFQLEREMWEHRNREESAVLIETTAKVKNCFSGKEDMHLKRLESQLQLTFFFEISEAPYHFYKIKQFEAEEVLKKKMKQ